MNIGVTTIIACILKFFLHPWKTIYAKIFYLLIACGLAYFLVQLYLRKQQAVKIRKMKEMEQIKNQELFQSKITFFTQRRMKSRLR